MRPSSRIKTSVPLVLPRNRHPERSASQTYRLTEGLRRGVEGPRRRLSYPCCSELFNHEPGPGGLARPENQGPGSVPMTIQCVLQQILRPGFGGRKALSSMVKISAAGVLRLRAASPLLSDRSARRFAQDDDSVGELTERRSLCGSRGCAPFPNTTVRMSRCYPLRLPRWDTLEDVRTRERS